MNALFPDQTLAIQIPDGDIFYQPDFFTLAESDHYYHQLINSINWTHRSIRLYGKTMLMPRLIAWYADPGIQYEYSNGSSPHNNWNECLLTIKRKLEHRLNTRFNGVLLNYYRNGNDSMGWHSDDEATLGIEPVIASLSFGATRRFELKHKTNRNLKKQCLNLEHGSLLVMRGKTQTHWQHAIPKDKQLDQARVNLTFRAISTSTSLD